MTATSIVDGLVDLLLPRRCVSCGVSGGWLCAECAAALRPLPARRCPRCGAPGPWSAPSSPEARRDVAGSAAAPRRLALRSGGRRCPECGGRDLAFVSAAAAFTYEGPARALVTACKFRALRSLTSDMVERASPAFSAFAQDALVTWVPGHRDHQLERGFNQSERLARGFAQSAGLPYAPLLRRARHGARQSGLSRSARAANVKGAFALLQGTKRVDRKTQASGGR